MFTASPVIRLSMAPPFCCFLQMLFKLYMVCHHSFHCHISCPCYHSYMLNCGEKAFWLLLLVFFSTLWQHWKCFCGCYWPSPGSASYLFLWTTSSKPWPDCPSGGEGSAKLQSINIFPRSIYKQISEDIGINLMKSRAEFRQGAIPKKEIVPRLRDWSQKERQKSSERHVKNKIDSHMRHHINRNDIDRQFDNNTWSDLGLWPLPEGDWE